MWMLLLRMSVPQPQQGSQRRLDPAALRSRFQVVYAHRQVRRAELVHSHAALCACEYRLCCRLW